MKWPRYSQVMDYELEFGVITKNRGANIPPSRAKDHFIGSGTVGNGCGLELGRYLEHGDIVELEVERIGVLRNTVERQ